MRLSAGGLDVIWLWYDGGPVETTEKMRNDRRKMQCNVTQSKQQNATLKNTNSTLLGLIQLSLTDSTSNGTYTT